LFILETAHKDTNSVSTSGGLYNSGDVTSGKDFIGRDQNNFSSQNNDLLLAIDAKFNRLLDNVNFEFKMLERDLQNIRKDIVEVSLKNGKLENEIVRLQDREIKLPSKLFSPFELILILIITQIIFTTIIYFLLKN
jgi:hypothetical protein